MMVIGQAAGKNAERCAYITPNATDGTTTKMAKLALCTKRMNVVSQLVAQMLLARKGVLKEVVSLT